jgi:hypothetical protein
MQRPPMSNDDENVVDFQIQGIPPNPGHSTVRSDTFRSISISGVMREIQIYRGTAKLILPEMSHKINLS